MSTVSREQLIEELKASTQNSSGMFEIGEETICSLMSLLTAPPATASVPDLTALDNLAGEMLNHAMNCERRVAVAYTHCAHRLSEEVRDLRAAMLQGAEHVSNRDELPDGWVACSERMPKKNDKVLIFIDFNSEHVPPSIHDAEFTGATFRRGGATVNVFPLEDGYGVTHWKPLPSPPAK